MFAAEDVSVINKNDLRDTEKFPQDQCFFFLFLLLKRMASIWFGCLLRFCGISTIVGYLMPNPVNT